MPLVSRECLNCHKTFDIQRWRLKDPARGKYCSYKCRQYRPPEQHPNYKGGKLSENCFICHEVFYYPRMIRKRKFCSRVCMNKYKHIYLSGINSHSYKDGRKIREGNLHLGYEYRQWRKQLFLYWNKCSKCNSTKELQADHIKPVFLYPELAYSINNGQLLCRSCHKEKNKIDMHSISIYKQELRSA